MKKEIYSIKVIVLLLIMAVSGCLEVPNSGSKTIYVNDGGGVDYVKIQDAIDNASDGDTIFVYNGTYNEILILNKSINLIGASKDKTVIGWQKIGKARQKNVICVYVDKCTIKGFKIVGAGVYSDFIGINVNTSYNTISDNIILSNYMGVNIGEGSKNNNVYRNNISNNLYGVALHNSNNNNISKNNISSCSLYGIYLISSNNNIIFGNTLSGNFYGMRVKASEKNRVFKNLVVDNKQGMYFCCGSGYNTIYSNNFEKNIEWSANDELFNQWYIGGVGNYWDDYNDTDGDGDGIGDKPYNISGGENQDLYPLIHPWGDNPPVANFSYTADVSTVLFNSSPSFDRDGEIISYEWSFGDGTNGTGMVVSHSYSDSGLFNVILIVLDNDGHDDNVTKAIVI